jgi:hypothetical protein
MSAFIDEVRTLLPGREYDGPADACWRDAEERLHVVFPRAFKDFLDSYGPGILDAHIRFFHPCAERMNLTRFIRENLEAWSDIWSRNPGTVPYPASTSVGGLLPWGNTTDGFALFFHMRTDDPADWTVFEYADFEYAESGLIFEHWLVRYLRQGGDLVKMQDEDEEEVDEELDPVAFVQVLP